MPQNHVQADLTHIIRLACAWDLPQSAARAKRERAKKSLYTHTQTHTQAHLRARIYDKFNIIICLRTFVCIKNKR